MNKTEIPDATVLSFRQGSLRFRAQVCYVKVTRATYITSHRSPITTLRVVATPAWSGGLSMGSYHVNTGLDECPATFTQGSCQDPGRCIGPLIWSLGPNLEHGRCKRSNFRSREGPQPQLLGAHQVSVSSLFPAPEICRGTIRGWSPDRVGERNGPF